MIFEQWWDEVGSGLPPLANEDHEMHMKRVAKLAVEAERFECVKLAMAEAALQYEQDANRNTRGVTYSPDSTKWQKMAAMIRLRSNAALSGNEPDDCKTSGGDT